MFSAARWRLTSVFTIALVVILVTGGVAVYLTTHSLIYGRVDSDLSDRAHQDFSLLRHDTSAPDEPDSGSSGPGGDGHSGLGPGSGPGPDSGPGFAAGGYFYSVLDGDGNVVSGSKDLDSPGLAPASSVQDALANGEAYASTQSSAGDALRVYLVRTNSQNNTQQLVEVGRSTEPEESALAQMRNIMVAVLLASIIPAIAGGYLLSGRALRPIKSAVDAQRTFIADASHELRTPVAVVRTNAELLQRHIGSPVRHAGDEIAVEDILSESVRLGKMVDQMLTLAQADAGQSPLALGDVRLNEVAEQVGRSMKALAEARGVTLITHTNGVVAVHGDAERLRELLVILVDNAIKYSDSGGRVGVSVGQSHRKATLTVTDTGPGIPPAALPHIFERFYRVDKARSRESGGTGLGLAIARHIAEAHGGAISMHSAVGKGTTVTVELRMAGHDGRDGARPA